MTEVLTIAPQAEHGAQGEPEGHHDQAVPPARTRGRDQRRGQAAAGGGWVARGGAFLGPLWEPQASWEGQGFSPAVPSLQFHCCGSNNSQDWRDSVWIRSGEAGGRVVPDSCCKTVVAHCGHRDHASNIYKVEVGGRGLRLPVWNAGRRYGHPTPWRGPAAAAEGAGGLACLQRPPLPPARAAASPSWRPSSRST